MENCIENNTYEQPKFSKENTNKVTLEIKKKKKTYDLQISRLNCLFELVLNNNYKISIIIDVIIVPIESSFELYDYYDKNLPMEIYQLIYMLLKKF